MARETGQRARLLLFLLLSTSCRPGSCSSPQERLSSASLAHQDLDYQDRVVQPNWVPVDELAFKRAALGPQRASGPARLVYLMSPISNQLLDADPSDEGANQLFSSRYKPDRLAAGDLSSCRSLRTSVQIDKDEVDPASGRILRTCRGSAQVNRCEGRCSSLVEPSAKSSGGLKKVRSQFEEGDELGEKLANNHAPSSSLDCVTPTGVRAEPFFLARSELQLL